MNPDPYAGLAARYDTMLADDPLRRRFFETLLSEHNVSSVLDCSCGTGSDLIMLSSFVDSVTGSDISDSMLRVARRKIDEAGLDIGLLQADFGDLRAAGLHGFDAVLCLSSSIDEIHSDRDLIRSLKSMYDALNDNGVLVVDQGQSDAMMQAAPRFIPIVNDPAFSRLFVLDYHHRRSRNLTVNICDLEHAPQRSSFTATPLDLTVRLYDRWRDLLGEADMTDYVIYGNWDMVRYDKRESKRLLIVVTKSLSA